MKKALTTIFNLLFIGLVLYFILHTHFYEIVDCLKNLSMTHIFILTLTTVLFFILDAWAQYVVLKKCTNKKSMTCACELVFLNHFFNGTTSSMGTIPFQSYYLKKRDIPYSQGIGAMFLNMIFHKLAVFANAIVALCLQWQWLQTKTSIAFYIYLGLILNVCILFVLISFIFWDKSKWILKIKKESLQKELLMIATVARNQLSNMKYNFYMFLAHFIKVIWLCMIPYFCIRVLKKPAISGIQIYVLSSLAYIVASSLPNVAGVGPLEFAYITLFTLFMPGSIVSTSLILYRFFSFYLLFIISTFVFLRIKKRVSC